MPATGREQLVKFGTATNLDSIFGYEEPYSDFSGALSSNCGLRFHEGFHVGFHGSAIYSSG